MCRYGEQRTLEPNEPDELINDWAHLRGFLSLSEQRTLVERCRQLMDGDVAGYVPIVRGGGRMHVRMLCLGRHWNGQKYAYEPTRSDHDNRLVPPLPDDLRDLASRAAAAAGMQFEPDVAILNFYEDDGRMGLHQDKDESTESIRLGTPIVSISVGDTARFLFGGLTRKAPIDVHWLESGDAFVFGGASRLRYHGVSRVVPHSAPAELGLSGRFNLTFRRY